LFEVEAEGEVEVEGKWGKLWKDEMHLGFVHRFAWVHFARGGKTLSIPKESSVRLKRSNRKTAFNNLSC
jgi:hypothetical protein